MTHILIPREPSPALLRPFIGCNTQELPEAYAAMVRIAEVQHARAGSQCLAQIEEPAKPARIVLDDNWKTRMLDGRAPERDEMGLGDHPELPLLDEGMMPRGFFAALGLELAHTSAEDQLDGDVLGAMSEAVNWSRWMPTAPQGDGWKLVSIFDTEDGPVAWWLRELPEAEDGTTTIRNLQAEVEQLKARSARATARAGAAPAAVAPHSEYPPLPEGVMFIEQIGGDVIARPTEYAYFKNARGVVHGAQLFTADQLRAYFDLGRQAAPALEAPALEAPAAPALDVSAIGKAVSQRVADMDDRSSPPDWPEAMLVTGPELVEIVEGEIAQAMAKAVAAPIMPTSLHVAARYWQWLEIMGRLTSFSTFVNEFGYEKEDCKQVYEQVVLPCFALLAAAPLAQASAPDWWRGRADEIEAQVARSGSKEAMRCYTDMRTLLQAAAPQAPAQEAPAAPASALQREAELLATILRSLAPESYVPEGVDIYAPDFAPSDGDVFVQRAAQVLEALAAAPQAPAAPSTHAGLLAAAAHIQAKAQAHLDERGSYDPDTGAVEMSESNQEHFNTLDELAEEIRLMAEKAAPASCDKPPAGWTCTRAPGHDGPCAAAPAAPAVDAWLQPDDMEALQRFHETAEDDESYDIGKEAVARLCAFGCLQSHSFGRYSTTDFGDYLLDTWAGARTLPFTTAAEREALAAQAKEGGAA